MSELSSVARQVLGLVDLTSLNDTDTAEKIIALCHQAVTKQGNTAAICIYPRFIPVARKTLQGLAANEVKIATVVNFPEGGADIDIALPETRAAIAYGADEIDIVFPWRDLLNGDNRSGIAMLEACKSLCLPSGVTLKVILETGELKTPTLIRKACEIAINAGADFLKTSTGKVPVNATPEAAKIMLEAIRDFAGDNVGFKAAGGVRTTEEAKCYLDIAANIMGVEWINPNHFRFGASGLLECLLNELDKENSEPLHVNYSLRT